MPSIHTVYKLLWICCWSIKKILILSYCHSAIKAISCIMWHVILRPSSVINALGTDSLNFYEIFSQMLQYIVVRKWLLLGQTYTIYTVFNHTSLFYELVEIASKSILSYPLLCSTDVILWCNMTWHLIGLERYVSLQVILWCLILSLYLLSTIIQTITTCRN